MARWKLSSLKSRIRRWRQIPRLAWVLLAICLAGSVSASLLVRAAARRAAARTFDVEAGNVDTNVALALKRADDLAITFASTLAVSQRTMTNPGLARWYERVGAGDRYPGLLGLTYIRYVPAARLSQFAAGLRTDPPPRTVLRGPLRVFPSGLRTGYCVVRLEAAPSLLDTAVSKLVPAGATLDICAMPGGNVLAATRDSGQLDAVVITLAPQGRVLNISLPIYSGATAPATVTGRRTRILGWALAQFSMGRILAEALSDRSGVGLAVARRNVIYARSVRTVFGPISAAASIGLSLIKAPLRRAFELKADGLWIVTVSGRPQWAGASPNLQGLGVLGVGTVIGLLVFTVVLLLARSRARSEGQLRAVLRHSPAAIFVRDRQQRYTLTNDAFDELFQLEPGAAIGKTVEELNPPDVAEEVLASEPRVLGGETVSDEKAFVRNGVAHTLTGLRFPLVDEGGKAYAVCGIFSDVTERAQLERRLRHLAEHDPLTGLYNRRRLIGELDRELRYANRSGHSGAVLVLDLDNFKFANDTLGHETGDTMLRAVAGLLLGRARSTDVVARLGNDEFALVLPEAGAEEALIVARDTRALLCERQIGPPLTASIGIATFTAGEHVSAEEIVGRADIALYQAREAGADQAKVYGGQTSGTLTWVQRIRTALDEDRFVLYGQPIFDLRTGVVSHNEILLRMLSDDGDIFPPASFLPTAERFGLIGEIDRWVTKEALRLALDNGGVTINLSGHSIGEQPIITSVREAIAEGLEPAKVIFEITETAAMTNIAAARQFVGTLEGMGCSLALDDFGTGFGSFTYLKHIPARYLKIDMEFVRDLTSSPTDQQVVSAIVHIAHSFNKLTIAEGVEDAETLAILTNIGVDCVQGYHLGEPTRLSPRTAFERGLCAAKMVRAPTGRSKSKVAPTASPGFPHAPSTHADAGHDRPEPRGSG